MTDIGPAESAESLAPPLPSLEELSDGAVSLLRKMRLSQHGEKWLLVYRDNNDKSHAVTDLGVRAFSPDDAEIAALLAERGLTMRDSGWEAWRGEEPNRHRWALIAPHKLNELMRREAAGFPPKARSSAELAWADWLTIIGALFALAAAFDVPGTSFSLVRFVLCGVSTALLILSIRRRRYLPVYPLFNMAFLWNPIILVHFPRGVWIVLDLIAAAVFIAMFLSYRRKKKPTSPTQ